ncbi:MAG: TldD/PmbA family protein [Prevotellaceae bacterium]|jgi:PmbA protein|nr:TldD/PmbA family protein [Prevotellaceae bacterium]
MNYKELAKWAVQYALENGAQACRASLATGSSSEFEYRDTQLDKLQQAAENSLSITLHVNNRYGSYSTNRIDQRDLKQFIKKGIETTGYLAEDAARQLPDPARYYKGDGHDLGLVDEKFHSIAADDKLALAKAAVEEVYGSDPRIISVSGGFSDGESSSYLVDSNGFEGETKSTYYNLSASVSMKGKGDARPESYWYDVALQWDELQKSGVGKKALERTIRKLGQQKIKSGKYAMLVDNLNVRRILSPLVSAMYGAALQQKNSFLLDRLNTQIASARLTLTDDPHIPHAMGARWFDYEGVATVKRPVIEKGVLQTYFIDTYISRKMDIAPTISGPSILTFELGDKNFDQLTAAVKKGIWITGFNGGNSNSTTGDFSFGVEGFLIENGKVVKPVSEMNITGNLLTLWGGIAEIGNDPRLDASWRTPSILFDNVDFSGL